MNDDMTAKRPRIAIISSGGTLTALSNDPFEIRDYGEAGSLNANDLIQRCGALSDRFNFVPTEFPSAPSFDIALPQWIALCRLCERTLREAPDIDGFVLTHGTGTLEETAFFLSLIWDFPVPLVVTGAQRPASAISSDGYMNFFQAACFAAHPAMREIGVAVVMHGEVHLPSEVTKTTTFGLDAFRSPDLGPIAQVIGGQPSFHRRPIARASFLELDWRRLEMLPRVDIVATHSGADAVAIDAFIAAGSRGIVTAGFAPGYVTSPQAERLEQWIREEGGIVVSSTRTHGPVVPNTRNRGHGFIPSGPYLPQKARILLQIALSCGLHHDRIPALFEL